MVWFVGGSDVSLCVLYKQTTPYWSLAMWEEENWHSSPFDPVSFCRWQDDLIKKTVEIWSTLLLRLEVEEDCKAGGNGKKYKHTLFTFVSPVPKFSTYIYFFLMEEPSAGSFAGTKPTMEQNMIRIPCLETLPWPPICPCQRESSVHRKSHNSLPA